MGYGMVTAHFLSSLPARRCPSGTRPLVTSCDQRLGQIGLKQEGTTEAYDLYAARSDDEDDARDGLKCEQLQRNKEMVKIYYELESSR